MPSPSKLRLIVACRDYRVCASLLTILGPVSVSSHKLPKMEYKSRTVQVLAIQIPARNHNFVVILTQKNFRFRGEACDLFFMCQDVKCVKYWNYYSDNISDCSKSLSNVMVLKT